MPGVHRNRIKAHGRRRLLLQTLTACVSNGYVQGFITGKVFGGPTKAACVPWLNCYSCPGAVASCPVGSLQTVLGGRSRGISFYVMGLLVLFGVVLGRLVCGLLCPFGFIQDLLYRIPLPKLELPRKLDRALRWLKYVVAGLLVVALPVALRATTGTGAPFFCKFLCPAGMLEGALPLMAANPRLAAQIGILFWWKIVVLAVVVLVSMCVQRPFCKYLCLLGAFYGLFNRVSLYQMHVERSSCASCHSCVSACPMGLNPEREVNGPECIRCGNCKAACPTSAIVAGFDARSRDFGKTRFCSIGVVCLSPHTSACRRRHAKRTRSCVQAVMGVGASNKNVVSS